MNYLFKSKDTLFLIILTLIACLFAFIIIAKAEKTYSYIGSLSEQGVIYQP